MKSAAIVLSLAVALAGVLRDGSVYFWKAGPLRTVRTGARFEGLELPEGRVGFVTGPVPAAPGRPYFDALYHFAPRVLTVGAAPRLVLADTAGAQALAETCAALGLRVVARGRGEGVALLERP